MRRSPIPAVDAAFVIACLACCYALKRHYSTASPEELAWILKPTASVVSLVTGWSFVAERGVGYVDEALYFAIGPSCAGVNFLIAVFATAVVGLIRTRRTTSGKAILFAASAVGALVVTVLVNAVRIVIAVQLHREQMTIAGLSGNELHRVEGIVVYFVALCALYLCALAVLSRRPHVAA